MSMGLPFQNHQEAIQPQYQRIRWLGMSILLDLWPVTFSLWFYNPMIFLQIPSLCVCFISSPWAFLFPIPLRPSQWSGPLVCNRMSYLIQNLSFTSVDPKFSWLNRATVLWSWLPGFQRVSGQWPAVVATGDLVEAIFDGVNPEEDPYSPIFMGSKGQKPAPTGYILYQSAYYVPISPIS